MIRTFVLLALLAGCSAPVPPAFPLCPAAPSTPAGLRHHEAVGVLEIRVELAREAERRRGDACAAAVDARDKWMQNHR